MDVTTLTTVDGVRLAAWSRWADESLGAVVLAHGFTASADHTDVAGLGDALHRQHYDVVTYDARGHGRSGGECTLGELEVNDVAAAVRAVRCNDRGVVLVGVSMGAIAVLRYAVGAQEHDPPLAGVVAVSCPARWKLPRNARGILSASLTSTPPGRAYAKRWLGVRIASGLRRSAPPVELVRALAVPVAFVHAQADPFIAVRDAHDLYAAAHNPRRLLIVPGAWHGHAPIADPAIVEAVDWVMATGNR